MCVSFTVYEEKTCDPDVMVSRFDNFEQAMTHVLKLTDTDWLHKVLSEPSSGIKDEHLDRFLYEGKTLGRHYIRVEPVFSSVEQLESSTDLNRWHELMENLDDEDRRVLGVSETKIYTITNLVSGGSFPVVSFTDRRHARDFFNDLTGSDYDVYDCVGPVVDDWHITEDTSSA